MEHNLTATDVSRNLFPIENKENIFQTESVKQKNMATLAQAPSNGFVQISSPIDEKSVLNNITHHTTVSKLKTQQTQSFTNHISNISKHNSLPSVNPTIVQPKENGRPHTTSQNRPPKIKLLNRSPAFNATPNINEMNGETVQEDVPRNEIVENKIKPSESDTKDDRSENSISSDAIEIIPNNSDEKDQRQSTPLKYNNSNVSTPPKQASFEYSSSPSSSTTSSLNRENSLDYKDSTGVDLHEFMVKTLRENPRDRLMLLKLERDFTEFINDTTKIYYKYPQMTSYHRMLIHRVAAYFGLDHNVDSSGKSVIISKTPASRNPDTRFQSYCSREYTDEEISAVPKSILLRSASSEDSATPPRYASPMTIDRRFAFEDKRSRSMEEREDDYNKAKERIFNKDSLETVESTTPSSPVDGSEKSSRSHDSHSSESALSEKEAAIAAVAAVTGRRSNNSAKRFNDRKNLGGLQFTPVQQQYSEGYPATAAIAVNQQTGHQYIGSDGNPIYYQTNYQQSPNHVAYVTNSANPAYMQQQPQQQPQQHPQQQQQQQQQSQYVPLYYVSGGNTATPNNAQAGQQYYMVQQTPSGQLMYIPTQNASEQPQSPAAGTTVLVSPQSLSYQDYANQMANMTLNARRPSIAEDTHTQEKQVTTPTSPVDAPEYPTQARQVMYMHNGRVVQGPVYHQQQAGYPLQYYPSLPGAYNTYSINQYGQPESPQYSTTQSPSPSPTLRSPTPAMLQQHFVNAAHTTQTQRAIAQTHQYQGQNVHSGSRPRFVPGIMPNPRASSPMYLPVAGTPQGTMLVTGQYPSAISASGYPTVYRSDKMPGTFVDATDHNVQPQQTRNLITVNQQQKPIVQLQPTYQPPYSYIPQPQRFVSNPVYNTPFIRTAGGQQRRYKPPRHPTSNQQIRISRPNSNTSEADQKTVSHILEIYEFPDSVTSDADAIFDEIKSSGARILKINSSSSQSLNNSHNGGGLTNQRPTILAIFKCASEAQKALETVTSPYYKLRVSQKSPTHFAGGNDYQNNNSTSPIKSGN